MKHQALFPKKDKSKKIKCHLLQFLFGALRINIYIAKDTSYCVLTTIATVFSTVCLCP